MGNFSTRFVHVICVRQWVSVLMLAATYIIRIYTSLIISNWSWDDIEYLIILCTDTDINECSDGIHSCQQVVTTLKDHTTASVLMVMNWTVMAIHVMVRMADMLIQSHYHADSLFHFTDVNECATGIDECNQNCHNTDGSYSCSCDPGYILYRDNLFCYGNLTQAWIRC